MVSPGWQWAKIRALQGWQRAMPLTRIGNATLFDHYQRRWHTRHALRIRALQGKMCQLIYHLATSTMWWCCVCDRCLCNTVCSRLEHTVPLPRKFAYIISIQSHKQSSSGVRTNSILGFHLWQIRYLNEYHTSFGGQYLEIVAQAPLL